MVMSSKKSGELTKLQEQEEQLIQEFDWNSEYYLIELRFKRQCDEYLKWYNDLRKEVEDEPSIVQNHIYGNSCRSSKRVG